MTKPINDKIAELYTNVFYFVLSKVDNYRDAEDIAQTVMEKAISKTHMLRNEARLKSWVIKIASNEINMYFRKAKKINSILFNVEEVFDFTRELENVNSVKTRYYRGLKSLKKEFLKLETGGVKFETEK